jgi:DNA invertase Pin-like site-specific DNA recombinase
MIYGYVRVSTEQQDWQNQVSAISAKYKIDEWVEEKRSGTVDFKKRDLGDLVH